MAGDDSVRNLSVSVLWIKEQEFSAPSFTDEHQLLSLLLATSWCSPSLNIGCGELSEDLWVRGRSSPPDWTRTVMFCLVTNIYLYRSCGPPGRSLLAHLLEHSYLELPYLLDTNLVIEVVEISRSGVRRPDRPTGPDPPIQCTPE